MRYDEETLVALIARHDKNEHFYRAILKEVRKKNRVKRFARFAGELLGAAVICLLVVLTAWVVVTVIRLAA